MILSLLENMQTVSISIMILINQMSKDSLIDMHLNLLKWPSKLKFKILSRADAKLAIVQLNMAHKYKFQYIRKFHILKNSKLALLTRPHLHSAYF